MAVDPKHAEGWWSELELSSPPPHGAVLVVAVELARIAADDSLLDLRERERAARFRSDLLRQRHRATHTTLRRLLGWRLGVDPTALVVTIDNHGKPALRDHSLVFNLSHSGGWALIALADDGMIGVDLELGERLEEIGLLAERLLGAGELAAFRALPHAMQARAFLTTWTRKEAALKALGLGLPGGMEHVLITEHPLCLRGDHARLPGLASLHLHDLPTIGGGAAALCQGPRRRAVVCRQWPTIATAPATAIGARQLPSEPHT